MPLFSVDAACFAIQCCLESASVLCPVHDFFKKRRKEYPDSQWSKVEYEKSEKVREVAQSPELASASARFLYIFYDSSRIRISVSPVYELGL